MTPGANNHRLLVPMLSDHQQHMMKYAVNLKKEPDASKEDGGSRDSKMNPFNLNPGSNGMPG